MKNSVTTFDNILNSARILIVAGGYNAFSYADIAQAVGISKPSIHHHFPSKVDLVRTLLLRYREEMEAGVAAIDRQVPDALEKLRVYASSWEKCILDASAPFCICALLASEWPILPIDIQLEIRAFFTTLSGWLTSVFDQGLKQQSIHTSNPPDIEAELFLATINGAMLSARACADPQKFGLIIHPLLKRFSIRQQ